MLKDRSGYYIGSIQGGYIKISDNIVGSIENGTIKNKSGYYIGSFRNGYVKRGDTVVGMIEDGRVKDSSGYYIGTIGGGFVKRGDNVIGGYDNENIAEEAGIYFFFWDKLTGGNDSESEKSDSSDRYYTPKKTSITRNNDVKPNIVNNPSSTNYYATVNVNQNQNQAQNVVVYNPYNFYHRSEQENCKISCAICLTFFIPIIGIPMLIYYCCCKEPG